MTPIWTTECKDWERRIVAGESLITSPPIFPEEGNAALDIFKSLRIGDMPGTPTMGEMCRPWIFDFVCTLFGSYDVENGRRLITEYLLHVSKKNFKALALDTIIPTPSGWSEIKDIKVGDYVFGVDGRPCQVIGQSDIFEENLCYEIEFSNGEKVVADAGHQWNTYSLVDGKTKTRNTKEIADSLFRNDGARNHSMPMPLPLDLPDIILPIAPYTLGAWLGDGNNRSAGITGMDEEVLDGIKNDGYNVGKKKFYSGSKAWYCSIGSADNTKCKRGHAGKIRNKRCLECERQTDHFRRNGTVTDPYTNISLTEKLSNEGFIYNKHIPEVYFRASKDQRLSLLQGLLDTDGTINKSGKVINFVNINERLSRDVGRLLSTLGIKYSVKPWEMSCSGVKVDGYAWTIQFNVFRDELEVFRIQRKLDRMRVKPSKRSRSRTVQVVNAKIINSVPVRCISVDSKDSQFLFGRTMLPTHNSGLSAGIMMTALIRNWRPSGEFYIIAPTIEVASNSFGPARDMVRYDEELSDLFQVQEHLRLIKHRTNHSYLKVIAAESETVSGKKGIITLVDELHAFGKKINAENMLTEATGGLASRPEGCTIYTTTQSDSPPAGIFLKKLLYGRGVRDGRIKDNKFLPVLYEFPEHMIKANEHKDQKYFYVTNPNLGASVDEEFLVSKIQRAGEDGEESMIGVLAKHLNVEIGINLRSDRWAGADYWQENADKSINLQYILNECEVIDIGIDGGGLDDLLGLAVVGRHEQSKKWIVWIKSWAHPSVLIQRKQEAARFKDFARHGDLIIVDRIGDDVVQVAEICKLVYDSGKLDMIGVDPHGLGGILEALQDYEIPEEKIIGISQGWKLQGAIKTAERHLAEGKMHHAEQPLMTWCCGNARVTPKENAVMITKQASGSGKIDPLMALFNAVQLMSLSPASEGKSFWES